MGNCLKSQLKEAVQNDSLRKLGKIILHIVEDTVTDPDQQKLIVKGSKAFSINVVGGEARIADSLQKLQNNEFSNHYDYPNDGYGKEIYLKNGTYDIEFSDKYSLIWFKTTPGSSRVSIIKFDASEFDNSGLETLEINGASIIGDLNILKTASLYSCTIIRNREYKGNINELLGSFVGHDITFSLTDIGCDVSSVGDNDNLAIFQAPNSPYIKGDIRNFAKCPNITLIIANGSGISGDIKNLADDLVSASTPKTSGVIKVTASSTLTLNGTNIGNGTSKYIKFGSSLPSGAEYTGSGYAVYATNPDS